MERPSTFHRISRGLKRFTTFEGLGRQSTEAPKNRPRSSAICATRLAAFFKTNLLTVLNVAGVIGGVVLALILRNSRSENWSQREIIYVGFLGDVFLRMLKCLILPLIVSSMISSIGCLDLAISGRIGTRAIVYYMSTTVSAVILGIVLVLSIHPGQGSEEDLVRKGRVRPVTTVDMLLDLVRNLFPVNLVQACFAQYKTVLIPPQDDKPIGSANLTNATAASDSKNPYEWPVSSAYDESTNILGLVMFSIVFGLALGRLGSKGRPVLDFFKSLSEAMMMITSWVIWFSPVGVLFLVASKMLEMESWDVLLGQLGMYFVTVLVGLLIHSLLVLQLIYFIVIRKLPFGYIGNLSEALTTAFATSSSSATLPVALNCLEEKNGIDQRVTRFVMPIGATINMDGTALYEAVAALFISQVRAVPLSIGSVVGVSITATMASIGAAGIPQAGLVTMVMVLDTLGLPAEDVSLILAVDWLLDRFRTTVNVLGDAIGSAVVYHLSKKELDSIQSGPDAASPIEDDAEKGRPNPSFQSEEPGHSNSIQIDNEQLTAV